VLVMVFLGAIGVNSAPAAAAAPSRATPPAAVAVSAAVSGPLGLPRAPVDGLPWTVPKSDKLPIPSGAMATSFDIEEPVRDRRRGHDYIFERTAGGSAPGPHLAEGGRGRAAPRSRQALRQQGSTRSNGWQRGWAARRGHQSHRAAGGTLPIEDSNISTCGSRDAGCASAGIGEEAAPQTPAPAEVGV
jgi:hypothetical protein